MEEQGTEILDQEDSAPGELRTQVLDEELRMLEG